MKILIVEDDDAMRDVLMRALEEAGHIVETASDGLLGHALSEDPAYDAVVLDIMLPGRDGLEIVRSIRKAGIATPVLLLTARDSEADTVAGLDAGADDYLRKPFGIAELLARVRSISRRERPMRSISMRCGSVSYDPASRRAMRADRVLSLTHRETIFLEYFLRNAGRALSREMIAAALWPNERDIGSNVIDVYVRRLRNKLHGPGESILLHTVRGIGYRLEEFPVKALPFATRITISYAAILMVALLLFCAVAFVAVRVALDASLDARLKTTASVVRTIPDVHDGELHFDAEDRQQFLALLNENHVNGVTLAPNGSIVSSSVPVPPAAVLAAIKRADFLRADVRAGNDTLDVVAFPIVRDGKSAGSIAVWDSRIVNESAARVTLMTMLAVSALLLIVASFAGALLVRRMLRPLTDLSHMMSAIEVSDLSERLAWQGPGDELAALGMAFDRLLDRLESAFERERRFTADASHEFRTPLAVMRAETELALRRDRTGASYKETLERLLREMLRLEALAANLLLSARSEALLKHVAPAGARPIAERAIRQMDAVRLQRDIEIRLDAPGSERIAIEGLDLERAIIALLENAVRFSPAHGTVDVTIASDASLVHIIVRDSGFGFSNEALRAATRRFWREDESRSGKGSGLGLAIVRATVERYGGTIALRNAADGGAIVDLAFPVPVDSHTGPAPVIVHSP